MIFFATFLQSCLQDEVHENENSVDAFAEQKLTKEILAAALEEIETNKVPQDEEVYKKYRHVFAEKYSDERVAGCEGRLDEQVSGCDTVLLTGVVSLYTCQVQYTATLLVCPGNGVQVVDLSWTYGPCGNDAILKFIADINESPSFAGSYYSLRNALLSKIFNDMLPDIEDAVDNAYPGTDTWFELMNIYVEQPCFTLCGSTYVSCGASCCTRTTYLIKEDGVFESFTSVSSDGVCQTTDDTIDCNGDPTSAIGCTITATCAGLE